MNNYNNNIMKIQPMMVANDIDKFEGDSFSSEDEKLNVSNTYDLSASAMIRKKSYRFMSIIEQKSDEEKSLMIGV
jgi:hypothetical protein